MVLVCILLATVNILLMVLIIQNHWQFIKLTALLDAFATMVGDLLDGRKINYD